MKNLQKLETTTQSMTTGVGGYIINSKHINVSKPEATNTADIIEHAVAPGKILTGRNIALYAMAAVAEDPENPGMNHLAPHATLINEGEIEIRISEMIEAYKNQIKETPESTEGTYRFIKCFAMAAGDDSLIINNGTIRIIFDNDVECQTPFYGETILAGENSTVINNGEIEVVGTGSFAIQARCIAVPHNNVTIVNNGKINLSLERAATVRILATTGAGGSLVNHGEIKVNSTGRIMTIARMKNTHLLNTGTVDIVSRAHFIVNKVSFLYQSYPLACTFYEHSIPNSEVVPPIVNTGKITMHLEGSEESTPHAVMFGIYSEMVGLEKQDHRFENTGSISLSKSGPYDFLIAELGANVQSSKDFPYHIEIGEWHTTPRNFAQTHDLFVTSSGRFDFKGTKLVLSSDCIEVKAEDLVYQKEEVKQRGDTLELLNTDKLKVSFE